MKSLFIKTKEKIMRRYRMLQERRAERRMKARNPELARAVNNYHRNLGEGSLRKNWIKYDALYSFIRAKKPKEILELGAGTSTVVMAHALTENERLSPNLAGTLRVTSMEE